MKSIYQDIWDTAKAYFWGLAILSVMLNTYGVIIGTDSLGMIIFISSWFLLGCALILTFINNKQKKNQKAPIQ